MKTWQPNPTGRPLPSKHNRVLYQCYGYDKAGNRFRTTASGTIITDAKGKRYVVQLSGAIKKQ